ncbi:putative Zinc-finger containing protein [Leptomonas pyrrhocoris]|uniref:Putative Zinc-finger containing protein n=1 Tax=Leptomonas pyrrhocoris TaxID=157538 RepID=A0A0M9G1M0_LEPPY|nr:putative Zinc-finger containing protein [Leptomonas pyrrhocoris]KPA80505.1 putative Zinc-finger containing protein [Leptomonas pyrrhocoris]|eukprot:XP_015658944.1 putative Zinc-finger containing protein [Leptomonas pyrrhocoris]
MVSFTCNRCQDVVKKPKVQTHANSCGAHSFTCVDCMYVFDLDSIKAHTSCVTEEDKYQGKWKQKLSSNSGNSGEAPRGIERPPRAPMNDLSSSDESDDDWVKKSSKNGKTGGGESKKKSTPTATAAAPAARRKNPRPGVSPSSDDEGDAHAPPVKKAKTARSASATPATHPAAPSAALLRSPRSASLGPKAAKTPVPEVRHATKHATEARGEVEDAPSHPVKKDTPLLLPRSTTSTECIVPSFVLGTSADVAEIVRDVFAERGVTAMRSKDLALRLVERYAKRIAKSVRHAVDTAVELGALRLDKDSNIALA